MEGYLKWAKILKIAFYVAIPIDIAILIYTIYTKNFSNLLVLFIAIVFTVWMKIQSKQMVEIYNKNPDAEVIDLFYLKYKEKEHIKSQKKIKRTDFAV